MALTPFEIPTKQCYRNRFPQLTCPGMKYKKSKGFQKWPTPPLHLESVRFSLTAGCRMLCTAGCLTRGFSQSWYPIFTLYDLYMLICTPFEDY